MISTTAMTIINLQNDCLLELSFELETHGYWYHMSSLSHYKYCKNSPQKPSNESDVFVFADVWANCYLFYDGTDVSVLPIYTSILLKGL